MNTRNNHSEYPAIIEAISATNEEILSQNARYELSSGIDDPDFKELALSSLVQEQRHSFSRRGDAASAVDFDGLGLEMLEMEKTRLETQRALDSVITSRDKIQAQADLSVTIAPDIAESIQRLATKKNAFSTQKIGEFSGQLDELYADELGSIALGTAWVIPQALPPEMRVSEAFTARPSTRVELLIGEEPIAPRRRHQADEIPQDVFWAVCDYALQNSERGVRVEEMRRQVPELARLSEDEYRVFRAQFGDIRARMEEKLKEKGVNANWQVIGKTRGTRYHFVTQAGSLPAPLTPAGPSVESPYTPPAPATDIVPEGYTPPDTGITDELSREDLLKIPFVIATMKAVTRMQRTTRTDTLKRTYLAKKVGAELGVEPEDATLILNRLISAGLLHHRGHLKGTRLLSTVPDASLNTEIQPPVSREDEPKLPEPAVVYQTIPEVVPGEPSQTPESDDSIKKLAVIKYGVTSGSGPVNSTAPIEISDLAKQFGFKNRHQLAKEAENWVSWLQLNPISNASRKVRAFKGVNIGDTSNVPLYRFSPGDCPELSSNGRYRRYRVVYALHEDQIVILDILDHDSFDRKYK